MEAKAFLVRGLVWSLVWGVALLALVRSGPAQTLKLGQFELYSQAFMEVGYDSNVDDVYPDEEDTDFQQGDFYWMPGLTLRTTPVAMRPRTTVKAAAGLAYQDYFVRNDLDTELYNVNLRFQTEHPRLTLGGLVSTEYSVEATPDVYYPGGASRDPKQTDIGNLFAEWNYRKLSLLTSATYTREQHDYEKYQLDDNDETILFAGAFLDNVSRLSLYTTWQNTDTVYTRTRREEDETIFTWGADWPCSTGAGFSIPRKEP